MDNGSADRNGPSLAHKDKEQRRQVVADKHALGLLGLMFASATAVVMLIAVVAVRAHVAEFAGAHDVVTISELARNR
jgi:hypothetical protein